MQLKTVKFDRVFDIANTYTYSMFNTVFSFENDQMRIVGARVAGSPTLKDGMSVSLVLVRDENWQTIIAWLNHDNGEVTAPSATFPIGTTILVGVLAIFCASQLFKDGNALFPLIFVLAFLVLMLRGVHNLLKAKKLLNDLSSTLKSNQ